MEQTTQAELVLPRSVDAALLTRTSPLKPAMAPGRQGGGLNTRQTTVDETASPGVFCKRPERHTSADSPPHPGESYGAQVRANRVPVDRQGLERLASAFSPVVLKSLGKHADGPVDPRLSSVTALAEPGQTLGQAFEVAHAVLAKSYRSEYVYKNELVSRIVFGRHSPNTAAALLEIPMGSSCADLVVVNGTTTTYEIKTDLDQLSRLVKQLADYCQRTEHVNVVVSEKRAANVERLVPRQVGVVAITETGVQRVLRPSTSNRDRLDTDLMFGLLRTQEALRILAEYDGYVLDVPVGHAWTRARQLFRDLPFETIHRGVMDAFLRRTLPAATLATSLDYPRALRALAYEIEPTRTQIDRIAKRLAAVAQ